MLCENLMKGSLWLFSCFIVEIKWDKFPALLFYPLSETRENHWLQQSWRDPGVSLCPKCHFQHTKLNSTLKAESSFRGPSDFVGSFILNLVLPEIAGLFFFATWLGALWGPQLSGKASNLEFGNNKLKNNNTFESSWLGCVLLAGWSAGPGP